MVRPLSVALAAFLALTGLPAAAQSIDEVLALCLDNYPNVGDIRGPALGAGFESEGEYQGMALYSAYRRDLIAGFQGGSDPVCFLGQDGLRDAAAIEAAQAALARRFGAEVVRVGPSPDGQFIEGWVAAVPGGGVLIGVGRNITWGNFFRGSLIQVMPFDLNQ